MDEEELLYIFTWILLSLLLLLIILCYCTTQCKRHESQVVEPNTITKTDPIPFDEIDLTDHKYVTTLNDSDFIIIVDPSNASRIWVAQR